VKNGGSNDITLKDTTEVWGEKNAGSTSQKGEKKSRAKPNSKIERKRHFKQTEKTQKRACN